MRILHVFDHSIPSHDGYAFRSYNILLEQRKLGLDTLHVTGIKQQTTESSLETVEGLDFHRTTRHSKLLARLPVLNQVEVVRSLRARIAEILRTEKVDIIHAHSPVLNGLAALRAGRAENIPVVYEIRAFWEDAAASVGTCREGDLRYRLTKWMETGVARDVDALFVICEGLKSDLVERGLPAEKITLIPNAVDVAKFSMQSETNEELRTQLGLDGMAVLGFIGSFYEYEGLELLIESMPMILDRTPQTRLLLVGGGLQDENLRKQCRSMGLEDKVIFTGRVPHDQVQQYYNLVDIFVYPRNKIRLTDLVTPLKPLEAMAQGKLVAASDIGGHNELIRNGENGILFKPDDPVDLATTICDALANREGWPDLIANGRKYVEETRNWRTSVSAYPAVYESVLKRV